MTKFIWGSICYTITLIFIALGFSKIYNYSNPEEDYLSEDLINAYVGGDAYNFIINANYATGYFILGLIFALVGTTIFIIDTMEKLHNSDQKVELDNSVVEKEL